jgi:hypothetical protein
MVTIAEGLVDFNKLPTVITLALATKLNYWTTNHHVGQGGWASYVLKVVRALVPEMANDAFKKELHMMCHWFGTHGSLRLFSIYTPVLINTLYPDPKVPVIVTISSLETTPSLLGRPGPRLLTQRSARPRLPPSGPPAPDSLSLGKA